MTTKAIVVLLVGLMLASVCLADAQQPEKFRRIGILVPDTAALFSNNADALRQGLRELGYVEGQNLGIEYRYAEGSLNWLPVLAAELVRLKVNVLCLLFGGRFGRAGCDQRNPHYLFYDRRSSGERSCRQSARPGGNITGVTVQIASYMQTFRASPGDNSQTLARGDPV